VSCYRLIEAEKAHHGVSRLARVLVWHAPAIRLGLAPTVGKGTG
jgi:hypothetical protein